MIMIVNLIKYMNMIFMIIAEESDTKFLAASLLFVFCLFFFDFFRVNKVKLFQELKILFSFIRAKGISIDPGSF